jgi:hypothetical protein
MAKARLPAFVQQHAGLGRLGVGDVEIPRLKLLQSSSPELTEFNNAKQGEFWHSLIDVSFGSTVRICPTYIDWRFILWRPREAGGGILARADDGKHWTPADTEFTFKLKNGLEVKWRTARTVTASRLDKRGSYNPSDPKSPPAATRIYYNYVFEMVGTVEDKAFYEENFAQYRFFMEQGLKVKDLEGAQEDEASSAEEKF